MWSIRAAALLVFCGVVASAPAVGKPKVVGARPVGFDPEAKKACGQELWKLQAGPGNVSMTATCMEYWAAELEQHHRSPNPAAKLRYASKGPPTWPFEDKCKLKEWFRSQGGTINAIELGLVQVRAIDGTVAGKIRGMVATRDITAGDVLIHAPPSLVISDSGKEVGALIPAEAMAHFGPLERLTIWLMAEGIKPQSPFQPFFCSMPATPPQVNFWSKEQFQRFMDKLAVVNFKAGKLNEQIFFNERNFREFLKEQKRTYEHNAMMTMLALRKPQGDATWFKRPKFATAFGFTHSRSYIRMNVTNTMIAKDGLNDTFPASFIPFADFINEADYTSVSGEKQALANAAHYMNKDTNAYTFVATRNIAAGEQVLTHYTSTAEASCSEHHFLTYGFLPYGCHERMTEINDFYEPLDVRKEEEEDEEDEAGRPVPIREHDLVGRRISVYWKRKQAWYDGVVSKFDPEEEEYMVRYDSGESVFEDLSHDYHQDEWRLLDTGTVGLGLTKATTNKKQKKNYAGNHIPKQECDTMVGRRVSVHDMKEKVWHDATIASYNSKLGMHMVHYDDSEHAYEHFSANGQASATTGRWRFTESEAPPKKEDRAAPEETPAAQAPVSKPPASPVSSPTGESESQSESHMHAPPADYGESPVADHDPGGGPTGGAAPARPRGLRGAY